MKRLFIISTILISFNLSAQKMGKLKDKRDGKIYPTVVIGSQTWMAENLNVSTFRNGDPIPEAKSKEEWIEASIKGKPAWCYYENRAIQDDANNGSNYGKLYNWFAVDDPRGIAPKGWHIPSDDEWSILINNCGGLDKKDSEGRQVVLRKMVSINSWDDWPNLKGENLFGLNILPGGFRRGINEEFNIVYKSGEFGQLHSLGYYWTSTSKDSDHALYRGFGYEVFRHESRKWEGYSVRCIKD